MKIIIDTPTIGSPSHDLLASAHKPDPPAHWEQGIAFTQEAVAGIPSSGEVVLEGETTKSMAWYITDNGVEYIPFLVEVGVTRPLISFPSQERENIARRALERGQRQIIEERMTTGSVGTNMFLTDSNVNTVTGTYSAPQAVAAIQAQFAVAGGTGTIYVSPAVADQLDEVVTEKDGLLYTKVRGDLVIVGNYGATGPLAAAAASGTSWVYGHLGVPSLYLSEVMVFEGLDWTTNEPITRAERVAAVVWNPGQWATLAIVDDGTP